MSTMVDSPKTDREADGGQGRGLPLSLDRIRKRYSGSEFAVDIPRLDVGAGEFLSLVGASGCGKSTTLRVIAGLEHPDDGDVWFGDKRTTNVPVQKRNLAMVFQDYALYPSMRVRGNLEYGLRKHGVPKQERARRVTEVAELLGVEKYLDRRPRELSGGEQQRVALGRAIIRSPDLLLMDEPLSNLDAILRAELRTEIRRIQRQIGCTTVYVTHDQLEAMTMSDRVAVMRNGRIEQLDTPEGVFNRPTNLYVARFIGSPSMNFIEGEVSETAEGTLYRTAVGDFPLPPAQAAVLGRHRGGAVVMGVRPHHVRIGADGTGPALTVTLVQLVGSDKHVILEGPGDTRLVARLDAATAVDVGARVNCNLDPQGIHLFSTDTGERLSD